MDNGSQSPREEGRGSLSAPSGSGNQANNNFLPGSILLAAVLISGSVLYAARGGGSPRTEQLGAQIGGGGGKEQQGGAAPADQRALLAVKERDVILGNPDAPVTVIEYGDYQCPFCVRFFQQTEPQIKENYVKTGKAKFIFRNLAFLGPESVEAAEAAECAKDQGKYWAFHDALYTAEAKDGAEHNGNLNKELFVKIAGEVGMKTAEFASCYDGNKYAAYVTKEVSDARAGGVNATPISFVNAQMMQGALPYDQYQQAIESALKNQ